MNDAMPGAGKVWLAGLNEAVSPVLGVIVRSAEALAWTAGSPSEVSDYGQTQRPRHGEVDGGRRDRRHLRGARRQRHLAEAEAGDERRRAAERQVEGIRHGAGVGDSRLEGSSWRACARIQGNAHAVVDHVHRTSGVAGNRGVRRGGRRHGERIGGGGRAWRGRQG